MLVSHAQPKHSLSMAISTTVCPVDALAPMFFGSLSHFLFSLHLWYLPSLAFGYFCYRLSLALAYCASDILCFVPLLLALLSISRLSTLVYFVQCSDLCATLSHSTLLCACLRYQARLVVEILYQPHD